MINACISSSFSEKPMNPQEFEINLYERLYGFFANHEFELIPGKKQFRRPLSNGFQNVILSPSYANKEYWLEVNLGVRLHEVEYFAQQFLDNRLSYREDANTVVVSIGKLTDNKYFRYKISDQEDMEIVGAALEGFMCERGFCFLKEISTLQAVDKLFNEVPSKPSKYVYNQVHRCFKGLIAAKLNHNPKFMCLMEEYFQYLDKISTKPTLLQKFDRMASYLLHYCPN